MQYAYTKKRKWQRKKKKNSQKARLQEDKTEFFTKTPHNTGTEFLKNKENDRNDLYNFPFFPHAGTINEYC